MLTVTLSTSYFSDVIYINVLQWTDNLKLLVALWAVFSVACYPLHCSNDIFVPAACPHQSSPVVSQSSPRMLQSTRHLCVACVVT